MSISFYDTNAKRFFEETISVDMKKLYEPFERHLSAGSVILDAGCGSGRDSLYFRNHGYNVIAIDASLEMVKLAQEHTGLSVFHSSFEDFKSSEPVDAIWACASLLHIRMQDMHNTVKNLLSNLKPNGIIYCSFKYGSCETILNGRHFSNLNELMLLTIFNELEKIEIWVSSDSRPCRSDELWINGLFRK